MNWIADWQHGGDNFPQWPLRALQQKKKIPQAPNFFFSIDHNTKIRGCKNSNRPTVTLHTIHTIYLYFRFFSHGLLVV